MQLVKPVVSESTVMVTGEPEVSSAERAALGLREPAGLMLGSEI